MTEGRSFVFLIPMGRLIHGIEYSPEWYGDPLKSEGGWSLEMIDLQYPFYDKGNWSASLSRQGGTPGSLNSVKDVNPDSLFYGIVNVFPVDSVNIIVRFSEPLILFPDDNKNFMIDGNPIDDFLQTDLLARDYLFKPDGPLIKSKNYEL